MYQGEMTILAPHQCLEVNLYGHTDEERTKSLECLAQDLYELIHEYEHPKPRQMTFRFVRQLCNVLRTKLSRSQMLTVLENYVKRKYY